MILSCMYVELNADRHKGVTRALARPSTQRQPGKAAVPQVSSEDIQPTAYSK